MEIIKSGLNRLDKKLNGGFRKDSLAVIAGRPGMGKTAFALQIAGNITKNGYNVILFSLEMSKDTVLERMAKQGVDNECHIIIDDTPAISVEYIADKAKSCEKVDAIIIDYFQLLRGNESHNCDNKIDEAFYNSDALKHLAKELNASVIVTSQISRPTLERSDKKPSLADFQNSGAIVNDADIIIFTYLEAYDPDKPKLFRRDELIIAKNNFGYTGYVETKWDGINLSFIENKVFEFSHDDFYPFFSEEEAAELGLRKVSEDEQNDISFLVNDEFVSYFTARPP